MIGTRDPRREVLTAWLGEVGELGPLGTNAAATVFGEIVVLATGWEGTEAAISRARTTSPARLIHVTNPLDYSQGA